MITNVARYVLFATLVLSGCQSEPSNTSYSNESHQTSISDSLSAAPANDPTGTDTLPDSPTYTVVVLGNSLAAGYGIDAEDAFPALVEQKARALGLPVRVINAGVSGDTSAGGLRRVGWLLQTHIDMLVLELGGNDGLRGIDLDDTYQNLLSIVNQTRVAYPDVAVVIAGMQVPPNLGPDYTRAFAELFPRLSQETGATFIPFLLEGVGGDPSLNLPDGIHPTEAGHQIVAETVWNVVGPILTAAMPQRPPQ